MENIIISLTYKHYEVAHEDGKGDVKTKKYKLIDLDKDGFVVFEDKNGKAVLIPKDRIVDMKQSLE